MVGVPQATTRPTLERRRSPALLALVFGLFLTVVGVTASAQTILVSAHLSEARLQSVVQDDTGVVRILVNGTLTPADLTPSTLAGDRQAVLQAQLAELVTRGGMLRLEVRAPDGTLLFSNDGRSIVAGPGGDFARAAAGIPAASIVAAPDPRFGTAQLLVEQLPIMADGLVRAIVVVDRDAVPLVASIEQVQREIVLITLAAAVLVAVFLYLIFRSAQRRLDGQTRALVSATRRDPLTGAPNHGALVAALGLELESARASGGVVGIAMVDIDGFRLFNDTHGHDAGDAVMQTVHRHLSTIAPEGSMVGRYGPDEFLVVTPGMPAEALEPAVSELRRVLLDVRLQFDQTDPLPITISAGLCAYPVDARSVTELLAVGAATVGAAKASGGDAIRRPERAPEGAVPVSSFDILRGLVQAIDTKDRYTKRHSEDVARYADAIATQLGVDGRVREAVHVAALLHDVGKIGIPDALLRKPAKLTAEEYAALGQHAVLGDMIVSGLPETELVRAGIRHHHERFDGRGYPDRLAGDGIPLVARILSVADTYSAMTTTRPYRVALDAEEATRRLVDAAGSQLDPAIVPILVGALADGRVPTLGDMDPRRARIWAPVERVA